MLRCTSGPDRPHYSDVSDACTSNRNNPEMLHRFIHLEFLSLLTCYDTPCADPAPGGAPGGGGSVRPRRHFSSPSVDHCSNHKVRSLKDAPSSELHVSLLFENKLAHFCVPEFRCGEPHSALPGRGAPPSAFLPRLAPRILARPVQARAARTGPSMLDLKYRPLPPPPPCAAVGSLDKHTAAPSTASHPFNPGCATSPRVPGYSADAACGVRRAACGTALRTPRTFGCSSRGRLGTSGAS